MYYEELRKFFSMQKFSCRDKGGKSKQKKNAPIILIIDYDFEHKMTTMTASLQEEFSFSSVLVLKSTVRIQFFNQMW